MTVMVIETRFFFFIITYTINIFCLLVSQPIHILKFSR